MGGRVQAKQILLDHKIMTPDMVGNNKVNFKLILSVGGHYLIVLIKL